jgi:transposase InsO family protein
MGIFEFVRVPMGPKGAPAYFQAMMVMFVLVGLVYTICEVYMDDILIHAKTEQEYLFRLEEIFKRFRKHKLTANPNKCWFGLTEVEFVGRLINADGISMTKLKLDSVIDFPIPRIGKELKQFLGLANYFRDHLRDISSITKPLHDLLHDYEHTRYKRIVWNEITRAAFEKVKEMVNNLPTLYFLDDHSPIYFHTDASDFCIGGYLFQVVQGIEHPVAFFSKLLSGAELNWSVPEKEGYAIYFGLKKLEYLIRDRKFTLRTDHKNLIYINTSGSAKVIRWKLAIQEYDFNVEHIAGQANVVADTLSRLVPTEEPEFVSALCEQYLQLETDTSSTVIQDFSNISEMQYSILATLYNDKIPDNYYKIIAKVHNSHVGHHGVERTLKLLRSQGHSWLYMRAHVSLFIKRCPCCQKMSVLKPPIHMHPFTAASYGPMYRLNVDTLGPFPEDEYGFQYILVVICCFSRWVELYPTRDTGSTESARVLIEHIGRYGEPGEIVSDNGPEFANDIIDELLKIYDVEHKLTLAYSKEENAIVERENKEILRHLRAIMFDVNIFSKWNLHRPFVQRILNSMENESIGVSPAKIIFGNSIELTSGIVIPIKLPSNDEMRLSEWSANMLRMQSAVISSAQQNQRNKDDHHMMTANARRTEYPVGSYVLVDYHTGGLLTRAVGPTKLHTPKRGPFRVVSFSKNKYILQNLVTGKTV